MYSTCLFCHSPLGANDVIEHFTVGRRLAYDEAKGRLWVVCRSCRRWNLTPLEERWEAIEECERVFRATRLRVSTDNIGMARVPAGLELIRIGAALRPEIVAWRYAATNRLRNRRAMMIGAASTSVMAATWVFGGPLLGAGLGWATGLTAHLLGGQIDTLLKGRHRPIRMMHQGNPLRIPHKLARQADIVARDGEWAVRVTHAGGVVEIGDSTRLHRLSTLLASINGDGVSKEAVHRGEEMLTDAGTAEAFLAKISRARAGRPGRRGAADASAPSRPHRGRAPSRRLSALPNDVRAALEMAANEQAEQAAMEGELAALADSWREAEEIAAIADDLFLPRAVTETFERLRGQR